MLFFGAVNPVYAPANQKHRKAYSYDGSGRTPTIASALAVVVLALIVVVLALIVITNTGRLNASNSTVGINTVFTHIPFAQVRPLVYHELVRSQRLRFFAHICHRYTAIWGIKR